MKKLVRSIHHHKFNNIRDGSVVIDQYLGGLSGNSSNSQLIWKNLNSRLTMMNSRKFSSCKIIKNPMIQDSQLTLEKDDVDIIGKEVSNIQIMDGHELFNFIESIKPTKQKPRATISRSAEDYLLVMQSILSTSNSKEEKIERAKHSIPSTVVFKIDGTKYRLRWWLSMLTSFGEQNNREKMELFSDFLLNRLFVYPEKRNEVMTKFYGITMEEAETMTIVNSENNTTHVEPGIIISPSDLISFYKSLQGYEPEIERNFITELRMVCKSQLIANYCSLKDLGMIRQVFKSVKKEEGVPSILIYNQMMSALSTLSSNATEDTKLIIQEIEILYSEIESPNNQCIHTMLHAYAKFGMYIQMEELAKKLEDKNSYTYSILLYGYTVAKRFSKALEVYSTISKPLPEHIRLVVSLLLQVGLDIQGERLIQSLPESVHRLRLTNELMDLYTKSGDFESVIRLFYSLQEPDCYSLGIVLSAYVKQKNVEKALDLFKQYCKEGTIEPNSIIYNLLIHGISLQGDIEKMEKFYQQIPKALVDHKTIVIMISAYLRKRDYRKTEQLYRTHAPMLKGSIYATTLIIKCYASIGKIHKAEDLFMTVKKPDVFLCNIMLDSYTKMGDMKKAYDLFSVMYKRDIVSYNTMLKGYAAKGALHSAETIFERIDAPDSQSYLTMLNALADHGPAESVETFFARIPKKYKNSYIYTCMMKFNSKLNRLEKVKFYYGLCKGSFHADHLMLLTYLKHEDFGSMKELEPNMEQYRKNDAHWRAISELYKHVPKK